MNFEEVVPKFQLIRKTIRAYFAQEPSEISMVVAREIDQRCADMQVLLGQIQAYTLTDNAPQTRNGLLSTVEVHREYFVVTVRPLIRSDVVAVQAARLEASALTGELAQSLSDAEEILSRLRETSGREGAGQLSGHYREQAKNHADTGRNYLVATGVLAVVTIVGAAVMFDSLKVDLDAKDSATQWAELVRSIVVRLFFLGLAAWAINFAVRNYRTNMHLSVVNTQKRNALDTYLLFVGAVASENERDLVTAELVRAVFSTSDSGFLGVADDKTIIENQSMLGLLMSRPKV